MTLMERLAELWTLILANPYARGGVVGVVVLGVIMLLASQAIWFERKWSAQMQNRPGPNQLGPFGLLQVFADFFKLLQKEDITPSATDRGLFNLAPPITVLIVLSSLAVVPFLPGGPGADVNIGVLLLFSIASLMVIPVWMAGWASNNKYALLGAMRAVAQSVSYEIPLLLSALVPVILANSFRLGDIMAAQQGWRWYAFWPPGPGLVAFFLFYLASLAEANRIPFDIPEAESELVAGISTEYPGMKFGFFYLAEYVHLFVSSAAASALFLGGFEGPGPDGPWWMLLKTCVLVASIITVRWTLLRYRSDQLLALCWHRFVPMGLGLVMIAGVYRHVVM